MLTEQLLSGMMLVAMPQGEEDAGGPHMASRCSGPEWTCVILAYDPLARISHMTSNTRGLEMQSYNVPGVWKNEISDEWHS